jgi:hypothetical protein
LGLSVNAKLDKEAEAADLEEREATFINGRTTTMHGAKDRLSWASSKVDRHDALHPVRPFVLLPLLSRVC